MKPPFIYRRLAILNKLLQRLSFFSALFFLKRQFCWVHNSSFALFSLRTEFTTSLQLFLLRPKSNLHLFELFLLLSFFKTFSFDFVFCSFTIIAQCSFFNLCIYILIIYIYELISFISCNKISDIFSSPPSSLVCFLVLPLQVYSASNSVVHIYLNLLYFASLSQCNIFEQFLWICLSFPQFSL